VFASWTTFCPSDYTEEPVRQLMKLRVLRTRYRWGDVLVQPAVVAGWTA
jgi:hypothetical protein